MLSFHVKFVQSDRRTTVKQYAPLIFQYGGIKIKKGDKRQNAFYLCHTQFSKVVITIV